VSSVLAAAAIPNSKMVKQKAAVERLNSHRRRALDHF
jgi:type II secretory pathway pseudopilin PulG